MSEALEARLLALWLLGLVAMTFMMFLIPSSPIVLVLVVVLVGVPIAGFLLWLLCGVLWATFYTLRHGEWPS